MVLSSLDRLVVHFFFFFPSSCFVLPFSSGGRLLLPSQLVKVVILFEFSLVFALGYFSLLFPRYFFLFVSFGPTYTAHSHRMSKLDHRDPLLVLSLSVHFIFLSFQLLFCSPLVQPLLGLIPLSCLGPIPLVLFPWFLPSG